MNGLSDKQFKEVKEACLSSYQTGYREGFMDACEQIRGTVDTLKEAAEETLRKECGKEEQ